MIPYSMLPIEAHVAMITAENANVATLHDAARMWTEVRTWIDAAEVELNTRVKTLVPEWPDDAGRALEEKTERTLAELRMWGDRIDASQVSSNLTTLATAIPEAHGVVTGLYQSYLAALSNPLTAGAAVLFQQASGARMTALGVQFDGSILTVCAAAGIDNPADYLPQVSTEGNSPEDFVNAVTAVAGATESVTGLASTVQGMMGPSGLSTVDGGYGGPALAGLAPVPPTTSAPAASWGSAGAGGAALPQGTLGWATAGGSGMAPLTKTAVAKRASTALQAQPATTGAGKGKATVPAAVTPPLMPPQSGAHQPNQNRPTALTTPTAPKPRETRRSSTGKDAVPGALKGRTS